MKDRPQRKPEAPLINPAAAEGRELAENFRRIYAGALADHRSIEAGQGVYAVRAAAPLEVTDDGVGLNWQDPRFYQAIGDLLLDRPESGKVKVDDGDASDFLENQLVDYNGPTDGWVGVHIVKPALHTPLQARVRKADLRPPGGPNGADAGSLELFIHYQGTDTITQTLDEGDWRGKLLRVWARSADTLEHLHAASNPISGLAAWLWPLRHTYSTLTPIVAVPSDGGIQSVNTSNAITFRVWADENDGGKLKLMIQNPNAVAYRGAWADSVAYDYSDVVQGGGGSYYQSKASGNQNHPTEDTDWWDPYTMLEGWFHCRLDVMGTVPTAGQDEYGNVMVTE